MSAENKARELRNKIADQMGGNLVSFETLVRQAHQEGYEQGCRETKEKIARELGWTNPHKS